MRSEYTTPRAQTEFYNIITSVRVRQDLPPQCCSGIPVVHFTLWIEGRCIPVNNINIIVHCYFSFRSKAR